MSRAGESWRVNAVLTGGIRPFGPHGEPSAIGKTPREGPLRIGPLGLEDDKQADPIHHGGVDKAIHHYPHDHYPWWRERLGDHPLLADYGAFGENITTTGLAEDSICLGDRFRLGTALIEVSQGRQPCWKLGHRFGVKTVPATVTSSGKCGWYYRVIESGTVASGDALTLVARPLPEWTVRRLFALVIGGEGKGETAIFRDLARTPQLAESWKTRARKLADAR